MYSTKFLIRSKIVLFRNIGLDGKVCTPFEANWLEFVCIVTLTNLQNSHMQLISETTAFDSRTFFRISHEKSATAAQVEISHINSETKVKSITTSRVVDLASTSYHLMFPSAIELLPSMFSYFSLSKPTSSNQNSSSQNARPLQRKNGNAAVKLTLLHWSGSG